MKNDRKHEKYCVNYAFHFNIYVRWGQLYMGCKKNIEITLFVIYCQKSCALYTVQCYLEMVRKKMKQAPIRNFIYIFIIL